MIARSLRTYRTLGCQLTTNITTMSSNPGRSYAATVSSGLRSSQQQGQQQQSQQQLQQQFNRAAADKGTLTDQTNERSANTGGPRQQQHRRRSPSPSHVPRTTSPEQNVYILTFLTDRKHHQTMTNLRTKYFPPRLNHLDAHLTLFHALPGSKLEGAIIPVLEDAAKSTAPFQIQAATPFRLKRGIAIGVPKPQGGTRAKSIHSQLQNEWRGFLSDQDAGGFAAHYTIMNKVDEAAEVDRAFHEVESSWRPARGSIEGFQLWLYEKGRWVWQQDFPFQSP